LTSNYETRPLGELVEFVAKGIPPKYASEKTDETITVLNQKTNRNFKIDYKLARLNDLSKKKVPVEKMLIANDVLINSTGVGTAGRIVQLLSVPEPTTVDGHMIIVRADSDKINPVYLGYALKAQQKIVENLQEGSTGQTELNRQRLLDEIEIQFPTDMEKQDKIASLFLSLDNRIAENEKINHHLEQMAQAIFKSWFVNFEPFGGNAPLEWNEVDFDEISTVQNGYAFKSKDYVSDGIRMIRTINFDNGYVNNNNLILLPSEYYDDTKYRNFIFKKFDTVLVMVGASVGKISLVTELNIPSLQNQNMWRFRTIKPEVPESFIHFHVKEINSKVRGWSSGSARDFYRKDIFKKAKIYLPTSQVLDDFSKLTTPIFDQISTNILENDRLIKTRNSLLPKLMSGEISISD
jgi:Restriction endonuclease S subunits